MENKCPYSLTGKTDVLYSSVGGSSPLVGSICLQCKQPTNNPKFCNKSCAAKYNNKVYPKRKTTIKRYCKNCNSPLTARTRKVYCSNKCQNEYQINSTITDWLSGAISGLTSTGTLKTSLKRYLISIRGDCCEICGWNEKNPTTGKVPIVADHIDGNWKNNRPENLRLICPNCDSLQPTYKALNKGNGREWRR